MLHASTIGGYVLEEVLAKLLADNGYALLTSDGQDPVHLRKDKHGLLVRGRGTDHQADALGDLLVPVPFSLPVRLFAEAKNRAAKTGLEAVRNAVGVVSDVNQFQSRPATWRGDATYHYRYSLFSTSGFTQPAQDFALAHQISLIDLSGPSFAMLREAAEVFASSVQALAISEGLVVFPLGQMRAGLRSALGTAQENLGDLDPSTGELPAMPWPVLMSLAKSLADSNDSDLILGFPAGPQILVLRPDDVQAFRAWALNASGPVSMLLRYAPGRPQGEWIAMPASEPIQRRVLLRFGTPPALAEWLFAAEGETRRRLDKVKRSIFSTITFYQNGRPLVMQLEVGTRWPSQSSSRDDTLGQLQQERLDPDLAWPAKDQGVKPDTVWTVEATVRYAGLLYERKPSLYEILLYAANHGDWISRGHVYELMGFEPERKMTGFTKPFDGVCQRLVEDRLLDPSVASPMTSRYSEGSSWAVGLDLDPELGAQLRDALEWPSESPNLED